MTSTTAPTAVYIEVGKKRVFASALQWPGWTRAAKTEESALDALALYAARYAVVATTAGVPFPGSTNFEITERVRGGATTDFGAPEFPASSDRAALAPAEASRLVNLLEAGWSVFDRIRAVSPAELRKGPRGGGRDREKMYAHVLAAEASYVRAIGIRRTELTSDDTLAITTHRATVAAVLRALTGEPKPAEKRWLPRYLIRRMAWHVLDHAWEMEDRRPLGPGEARGG